ncbi:bifunctional lysylphosphatidylglycerol flippase/synthetase MprF [Methylobrevis albus]|uniref:Bifunctional lysylphosphatidylglycerol flippase/synthetase MprF n=1 Tax=Methylobrevis albus TaxID=2793297 RepID=A0A931I1F7_9HYPH|nr:bifunctional lysylphosphatidylglycerol flippase/synthetase MprF [Methylobrevis albus]MBH0237629.1 bifunctional lysylphosphatidylglycerol flippase/synthetase MprF [Methylobrevis albus]
MTIASPRLPAGFAAPGAAPDPTPDPGPDPAPDPAAASVPRRSLRRLVPPLAGLALAVLAVVVLERHVTAISLGDVSAALAAIPASALLLAVLATAVSFLALGAYDVVAVRSVAGDRVDARVAMAAGSMGYAVSNALGFPLLTGGALRWRIYAAEGLGAGDIAAVVALSWFALMAGVVALVSLALVADPAGIRLWPWHDVRIEVAAGGAGLALLAAAVTWLATGARRLTVGRVDLALPSGRAALAYLAAGLVDLAAAAAALWVLLPTGSQGSLAGFAFTYVAAIVLGIASHAPGGLGVFEATMVAGLGLGDRPEALAGLVAYRLIYTVLPLGLAALGLAVIELRRSRAGRLAGALHRAVAPAVPPAAAALVFGGGIVLLASGATPGAPDRLDTLADLLPLPFVETSHLAASLVGLALLVVARGLYRRLRRAYSVAVVLLVAGAAFSLAKGLDWEEASVLAVTALLIASFRDAFYRAPLPGGGGLRLLSPHWLGMVAATLAAATWLGFFAYREVAYQHALWWEFAFGSDAPRFLRASVACAALLAALGLDMVLGRRAAGRPDPITPEIEQIAAAAPNAGAALAFTGDKRFLVDAGGAGFVMYAASGGSLVALGGPVTAGEDPADPAAVRLDWAFRERADQAGLRCVFYGVEAAALPRYLEMGLQALKLGEVARVDLAGFGLEGSARQELRYADRRADKEGLVFRILPKAEVAAVLPRLKAVSDAWLVEKSGAEKRFSLGRFDGDYLRRFDCAVLEKDGEIVAFANLWRGAGRHEIAVDLMRYLPGVSKIMMDALFVKLLLHAKAEGYRWFNLGAAPFAGLARHRLAARWSRLGALLYRRGGDLYHFEGLRAFKAKFGPVWTPHYLVCPAGFDQAQALIDVGRLINGSPLEMLRR